MGIPRPLRDFQAWRERLLSDFSTARLFHGLAGRPIRVEDCEIPFIIIAAVFSGVESWNDIADYGQCMREGLANFLTLPGAFRRTTRSVHRAIHQHWQIENQLHWILDVGFHEDHAANEPVLPPITSS